MRKIFSLVFCCFSSILLCLSLESAQGRIQKYGPVKVSLVSENISIDGSSKFWLGLWMQKEKGWHTYWSDPGDVGVPPTIEWVLPDGINHEKLVFPVPEKVLMGKVGANGHRGKNLFLCEFSCEKKIPLNSMLKVEAKVSWLACSRTCQPGYADLTLNLPVVDKAEYDPFWRARFELFRKSQPVLPPMDWAAFAYTNSKVIRLLVPVNSNDESPNLYFFGKGNLIRSNAPQKILKTKGFWEIHLQGSPWSSGKEKNLSGLLYRQGGWDENKNKSYYQIDLPLKSYSSISD